MEITKEQLEEFKALVLVEYNIVIGGAAMNDDLAFFAKAKEAKKTFENHFNDAIERNKIK